MTHLVFVYGSLKQGFPNAHVNGGRRLPGAFRTRQRLPMYLLGDGHVPCLLIDPGVGHQVLGEVYEVGDASLALMDRLERLGEPDGYLRVHIEVESVGSPQGVLTVFVYARTADRVAPALRRVGPLSEYSEEHAKLFKWRGAA